MISSDVVECYNWELSVVFKIEANSRDELEARASELAFYQRPITKASGDRVARVGP